jgi:hypothetical protein
MRSKLSFFFAGALVALISVAATRALDAKPSFKNGSHVNLAPEDYIEIMQIMSMYARDVDPGSVRDASWMFSKDARSVISGAPMIKPIDYKNFYSSLVGPEGQASKGGVRHFNATPVIIGLPDGTARGSSYMVGITQRDRTSRPEVQLFGKYEDVYVKTKDGWRIKERIWRADSYVGSRQEVAPSPVLGDPKTYTTETEAVIKRLTEAGQSRDAQGNPVTPPRAAGATPTPGAPAAPGAR